MYTGDPITLSHRATPNQLDEMIPHVAYEVAAVEASAKRFVGCDDRFMLEAFLLHVRLLREFLWGMVEDSPRYADSSLYAEDYFPDVLIWRDRKGPLRSSLAATKDPIDKQLAHVCRERIDPSFTIDLEAQVSELQTELLAQWQHFLRCLGNDPRTERLRAAHQEWRRKLRIEGAT